MKLTIVLAITLTLSTTSARSLLNLKDLKDFLRNPYQYAIPVSPTAPYSTPSSTIHSSLTLSSIIPEVLDDFSPSYALSIIYPETHSSVELGNDIPVPEVKEAPVFEIHSIDADGFGENKKKKNATFTLILTDPDAKSRSNPKWSEMCHWIVTRVTVDDTISPIRILANDELISYLPPGPPPKTGRHRYVFVLLKGEEGQELSKPKERQHWGYGKVRHGVRDWAGEMDLEVVGANWFYALNKKQ
jgi:phosphatidylethanolamine-binding protein